MSDEFWIALLTGSLTLSGAVVVVVLRETLQRQRMRRSIRARLKAEVSAVLGIVEARDYIKEYRYLLEVQEQTGNVQKFTINSPPKRDRIYDKAGEELGLIPHNIATGVVTFYNLLDGILADIDPIDGRTRPVTDETLELMERAIEIGERLEATL